MDNQILIKRLRIVFSSYEEIKLAYFFGSKAKGNGGILSDYDFAVYLNQNISIDRKRNLMLELIAKLSKELATEKIDLVVLNDSLSPLLKYNILKEGILIYENEPYKILIEPQIYNEYLDFQSFIKHQSS